ncbi:MAG TPA: hypothetical protein VHB21_02570 [Minicystis sp.]|nr:hypothetical protein [Minicystis sp.]
MSRTILSSPTVNSIETTAAWQARRSGSGCKADSVVVAWENPSSQAVWVNNCGGSFGAPKVATTSRWGVLTDLDGQDAASYGVDASVIGVPGRNGVFAFAAVMTTTEGNHDLALATSVDGGQNFSAQAVVNDLPGVALPVLGADPTDSNGTIYAAWQDGSYIYLRKATVAADGSVALSEILPSVIPPNYQGGGFTLAVENGTVWLAYADLWGESPLSPHCDTSAQTVHWYSGSTSDDGMNWTWQPTAIDGDANWKWCVGNESTSVAYGNDTRPELVYAPGLNQLAMAYAKTGVGNAYQKIYVATFDVGGSGNWVVQKPADQPDGYDSFRPSFASYPTASTSQAFGLSWLRADQAFPAGNVTAWMTTSTTGATSWANPQQISASSWQFGSTPWNGGYAGMAAVGGGANDFWPAWVAVNSGHDVVVTAEWSTP